MLFHSLELDRPLGSAAESAPVQLRTASSGRVRPFGISHAD